MIFKWKISVLGDPSVGKTSLVRRYVTGAFSEAYLSTIGVTFLRKELTLGPHEVSLQIWDLGGQNLFSTVRANYLRGTHGALVLFDLTQKTTLAHVQQWIDEIINVAGKIPIIVIGNKSDLPYKETIDERALALCQNLGYPYLKTSAKTGDQMEEVFNQMAVAIMKEYEKISEVPGGDQQ
jgi:small GTP-binding protein